MRLNDREKTIIAVAGINATLSIQEIAKLGGYSSHTVRYSLEKLLQRAFIRKAWVIDIYKLGWTRFNIFFSTSLQSSEVKKRLLQTLIASERTAYLSETSGDYDYELALLGRDVGEVLESIRALGKTYKGVFFSKAVSTRHRMNVFPRKYLSQKKSRIKSLSMGASVSVATLDQLDHLILKEMSQDAFISIREIARKSSTSVSTIEKRVQKLRKEGVIVGCVYSTNPLKYDCESFVLMLFARGFDSGLSAALYEFAEEHPHCTYFIESFGSWDYELGVEVENHAQLVKLREELGEKFGMHLNTIRTLTRLNVHKYSSYPFENNPSLRS